MQQQIDEEEIYYSHLLKIICSAFGLQPDIWQMFKGLEREIQNDRANSRRNEDLQRAEKAVRSKDTTLANRQYQ